MTVVRKVLHNNYSQSHSSSPVLGNKPKKFRSPDCFSPGGARGVGMRLDRVLLKYKSTLTVTLLTFGTASLSRNGCIYRNDFFSQLARDNTDRHRSLSLSDSLRTSNEPNIRYFRYSCKLCVTRQRAQDGALHPPTHQLSLHTANKEGFGCKCTYCYERCHDQLTHACTRLYWMLLSNQISNLVWVEMGFSRQ